MKISTHLNSTHISDLIHMCLDDDLNQAENDSLHIWASLHAWRALGQLKASQAIPTFIQMLIEEYDNDWVSEEIPVVLGMMGKPALDSIANALSGSDENEHTNISFSCALVTLAKQDASLKPQCIDILAKQLQSYEANGESFNGFIILNIIELDAGIEHQSLIKEAFDHQCVDEIVQGDYEDIEVQLGLKETRSTPRPNYFLEKYPELKNMSETIKQLAKNKQMDNQATPTTSETATIQHNQPKVGRNAPCPCGSGKKYKKCCLH